VTTEQALLFALLAAVLVLLVWGRVRYDVVGFGALIVALVTGLVPKDEAFSGFAHPAVVIVALVLIASAGLSRSGAVDILSPYLVKPGRKLGAHVAILSTVAATLSSVINNVAALALLMPIDVQAAKQAKRSPALTLMPLSFATILGGMVTLLGTPPNIVVATFRAQALGEPYGMFDFTPVGLVVAVAGIAFMTFVGRRLVPVERTRHDAPRELEDLEGYVAEAEVGEKSAAIGSRVSDLLARADEADVALLGLVRGGKRLPGSARDEIIREQDLLVLEGGPEAIERFLVTLGLKHAGAELHGGAMGEALALLEAVVPAGAEVEGRSAREMALARQHGVVLLGISRRGRRLRDRVRNVRMRIGDLLLLLGPAERLAGVATALGCLPLAERGLRPVQRDKAWLAIAGFLAAIVLGSTGLVYLPFALGGLVVLYALLRILPLGELYDAIEWPVIVLLASLLPIAAALESSGATALVGAGLVSATQGWPPVAVLAVLMIVTMTLSDVLNNVATALVAAPIAIDVAARLGVSADPFLMAVAVASSCAFLTPIGHKNNLIVMGPGGYAFGDYWRVGLPLEILVLVVGLPMILLVWPL
jgi:di/tricarboxylate transporter